MASNVNVGGPLFFCFLTLQAAAFLVGGHGVHVQPTNFSIPFNRTSFPPGFIFGAGSAAYQYEGATSYEDYGRGTSIWDTFVKEHPEKIADHSTGDVAQDFYHRYKEDIKLMKKIGLDSFRFSLSWPRLLPKGKISGGVNLKGVQFYNNLINELLSNGLVPFVTLYHWDLPQALEDEYGGWLSPKIVEDYVNYTDFCFKTFGDRVKHWVTLNEPNIVCWMGYDLGVLAPGRCSNYVGNCNAGDSATEPYIVSHHFLLAHATAVKLYRENYQAAQKGQIGITIISSWFVPKYNTSANRNATARALDFRFGWFANPVTYGDYPTDMKALVGNRLPKFTEAESKMLNGSIDFLGVNYYGASYAQNNPFPNSVNLSYSRDDHVKTSYFKNGVPIGIPTVSNSMYIYPKGLGDLMVYTKEKYNNPPIYVTENGVPEASNSTLKDNLRIRYLQSHTCSLLESINEGGANVKAYYVWSFMDDFEWNSGYTERFGLVYIDYKNNLTRHLKYSAYWFKLLLQK